MQLTAQPISLGQPPEEQVMSEDMGVAPPQGRSQSHTHSQLERLDGDAHLERVVFAGPSGSHAVDCRALFIMIGAAPNTDWLSGLVELDGHGFVRTGRDVGGLSSYATSCPGIFAVGDVRSGSVKRVASSVGEGSVVVSAIWTHVNAPPAGGAGIGG